MSTDLKACCSHIPQRWIVVIISFFGLLNAFSMRMCLSMAIVEMVTPLNHTPIELKDDTCPGNNNNSMQHRNGTIIIHKLFDWSESTQGIILSSFYWSYIISNFLSGAITDKFGGKKTLGLSTLVVAVLTMLTPVTVTWGGAPALIMLRVIMGLSQGVTYPSLSVLIAQWIPDHERSKAGSIVFAGSSFGTIFGMTVSGLILHNSENGWPLVFYFFGGVGVISFLLTTFFCYDKPTTHPYISDHEVEYLQEKLINTHSNLPPTPWKHLLKSIPVWALIIVSYGRSWAVLTMASDMPKYLSSVLKFSVRDNGFFSSAPYLLMWIISVTTSWVADYIIAKEIASITLVRKIGSSIASFGAGSILILAAYAGCDGILVVTLITIGVGLIGCATFSSLINHLDLSPNYAGSLMGFINGVATIGATVSPYLVGLLTPHQTVTEWRLVFWIVFVLLVGGNVVFLIFGTGNVQPWNDPSFLSKKRKIKRSSRGSIKEVMTMLPTKSNYLKSLDSY